MWVYNQKSTFLCTKVYTKLFYKLTHTNVYQMYTNLWMLHTHWCVCKWSTFLCTKVYTKLFYKLTHNNVYQMYTNLWMSATYTLMCMQMCTFGTQFLWECTPLTPVPKSIMVGSHIRVMVRVSRSARPTAITLIVSRGVSTVVQLLYF